MNKAGMKSIFEFRIKIIFEFRPEYIHIGFGTFGFEIRSFYVLLEGSGLRMIAFIYLKYIGFEGLHCLSHIIVEGLVNFNYMPL